MYTSEQNDFVILMIVTLVVAALIAFFLYAIMRISRNYLQVREQLDRDRIEVIDEERRRIAADLHDDIGSILYGTKAKMESVDTDSPRGERFLKESIEQIDSLATRIQQLSWGLAPASLELFGPLMAIKEFYSRFVRDHPLKLKVTPVEYSGLTPERGLHLYRMLQEILNNAIKHVGPGLLTISGETTGNKLIIHTRDNGKGFDIKMPIEKRGQGLQILSTRAHMIGAELFYDTGPGGTSYRIEIPLTVK